MRRNFTLSVATALLAAGLFLLPVLAGAADREPVARLSAGSASVDWQPVISSYEKLVLTVSTPDDQVIRREFAAGDSPKFSAFDAAGKTLRDGTYVYELRVVPVIDTATRERLKAYRNTGDRSILSDLRQSGKLPQGGLVQSGSFAIVGGTFVVSDESDTALGKPASRSSGKALTNVTAKDQVIADDLVVDSTGRVGLRTSTPALDLHINTNDTPAIRLEQNSSDGLTAQTWDIGGSEANFFVRDVTGGSRLPFRIRPGAPTSSLDISAAGDVGIGTASPDNKLFTECAVAGGACVGIHNSSATGFSGVEFQEEGGTVSANFSIDNANNLFRLNATNSHAIALLTESRDRMRITSAGSVGIGTTAPSSRLHVNGGDIRVSGGSFIDDGVTLNAPDYVFASDYHLMPLNELAAFTAREKHLPNVPSASDIRSSGLNLSQFQMKLLEKVEELTLYTLTQHEQITLLLQRLSALESRLTESSPQR